MARTSLGKKLLPHRWHERLQVERYPIHTFLHARFLPLLHPGMTMLDVGSGRLPDEQLHRAEFLSTGVTLETLDFLPGEGVDHVADAANTGLPDQQYDALVCLQVMEHVPSPQAVSRELFRLAKPGAPVAVSAPQSAPLHNMPFHFYHFTCVGMRAMLEDAGFEVLSLDAQGGHFTMLAMLQHYNCVVMDEVMGRRGNPLWYKAVRPFMRVWYGFLKKAFYLKLDKMFFLEDDTQGWMALCRKPA